MSNKKKNKLKTKINMLADIKKRSRLIQVISASKMRSEKAKNDHIRATFKYQCITKRDEGKMPYQQEIEVIKPHCTQKTREILSDKNRDKTCLLVLLPLSVDDSHHINEVIHFSNARTKPATKKIILDLADRRMIDDLCIQIENDIDKMSKLIFITHNQFINLSIIKRHIKNKCNESTYAKICALSGNSDVIIYSFQQTVTDSTYSLLPVQLSQYIIKCVKSAEINHLSVVYSKCDFINAIQGMQEFKKEDNFFAPFFFTNSAPESGFVGLILIRKLRDVFSRRSLLHPYKNGDEYFFRLFAFHLQSCIQDLLLAALDFSCSKLSHTMNVQESACDNLEEMMNKLKIEYNKLRREDYANHILADTNEI